MSKITIHNYESFLLDYSEGTLCTSDKIEMELFLKQNSKIINELVEFSNAPQLINTEIKLPNRLYSFLKKNEFCISKIEFNTLLIKEVEGVLLEDEIELLNKNKNNFNYNTEKLLLQHTVLKPDLSIIYPNKNNLKKKSKTVALYYYLSVAAMLLVFFGSYYLFNSQPKQIGNGFANKQFALLTFTDNKKTIFTETPQVEKTINPHKKHENIQAQKNNLLTEFKSKNRIFINYNAIIIRPFEQTNQINNVGLAFVSTENNIQSKELISPKIDNDNSDFLTFKEFINYRIKKAANKNDNEIPILNKKSKVNSLDLACLAVNAITSVSTIKLEFQKTYAYDGTLNEIKLRGENFEVTRKK